MKDFRGLGVSDRAGGSDNGEVGFWWRWQRARRGATRQGRRRGKAKAGAGRKAKEWQKGGREGVCVETAAAVTVVSWGR